MDEIIERLTKHYVKRDLPEEESLYALKSLKKNRGSQKLDKNDIAFV